MVILDTNCLIRFLTRDDEKKAEKVKQLIESEIEMEIPDVVFDELEYVLGGKYYNATKQEIIKAYKFFISHNNITVSQEIRHAVAIYEQSNLDMADCLIAAKAILSKSKLASFDKELLATNDVKSYW